MKGTNPYTSGDMRTFFIIFALSWAFFSFNTAAQQPPTKGIAVIGYYSGKTNLVDTFPIEILTHIIFSFGHLKGDQLYFNSNDSAQIMHLVALKNRNPSLKVILSLGGWGGCKSCSDTFAKRKKRKHFATSTLAMLQYFKADGIDLDWEYPALANVPGYPYAPADKKNFTRLVIKLRQTLGPGYEISFAAGGFSSYILHSIDWKKVIPQVNRVNLMSYDLINGYDTITGHHTPLYSNSLQIESADHAIHLLDSLNVPLNKIAIGAAFYARIFEQVDSTNDGLHQHGHFLTGLPYRDFATRFSTDSNFTWHFDPIAKASWAYSPIRKLFATFDDPASIRLKTQYVMDKKLNGIMFWQLGEDRYSNGLLNVIDDAKQHPLANTTSN